MYTWPDLRTYAKFAYVCKSGHVYTALDDNYIGLPENNKINYIL